MDVSVNNFRRGCCSKLMPENLKTELKKAFKLSWPLCVSYSMNFAIPIISLQFAGYQGKSTLAAVGLAVSFCNAFGMTGIYGNNLAMQTLCSQAYGAGNLVRFGTLVQRYIIATVLIGLPVCSLWINAERILLGLGQESEVARLSAEFLLWYLPVLWLTGLFLLMSSYLICQEKTLPLIFGSLTAIVISIISNLVLVKVLKLGLMGLAFSTGLAYLAGCIFLLSYINIAGVLDTWSGWSWDCLNEWGQYASLAIPGIATVFLDWGSSEAGIYVMGIFGQEFLGAQVEAFNLLCLLFNIPFAISNVACVRVGYFLGSDQLQKAKDASKGALMLQWIVTILMAVLLVCTKDYVGYIFTNSTEVVLRLSTIVPFMAAYHVLDGTVIICAGILRGLGLHKYVAAINCIGYCMIGLPLGIVLAVVAKIKLVGLWTGLVFGAVIMVTVMLITVVKANWKANMLIAIERANHFSNAKKIEKTAADSVESSAFAIQEAEDIPLIKTTRPSKYHRFRTAMKRAFDNDKCRTFGQATFVFVSCSLLPVGIFVRFLS